MPVKVIAGCRATGRAPTCRGRRRAPAGRGCRWCGRRTGLRGGSRSPASWVTTFSSMSSGTVSRSTSQARATAVGLRDGDARQQVVRCGAARRRTHRRTATISWPRERSARRGRRRHGRHRSRPPGVGSSGLPCVQVPPTTLGRGPVWVPHGVGTLSMYAAACRSAVSGGGV